MILFRDLLQKARILICADNRYADAGNGLNGCLLHSNILWDIPRRWIKMATVALVYDAKMDSKKRVTLRGAKYEYYNVQEMDDGSVILSPRVLVSPFEVSENALKAMDQSMENFKAGKVSKPIKL